VTPCGAGQKEGLPGAGIRLTPVADATVWLRRKADDAGIRALVPRGGAQPLALGLGWRLISSVGDLIWRRHSQILEEVGRMRPLTSSLGQLSSSGSIAARPLATQTYRGALHGNK
jgi:hypothetical protein